MIKGFRMKLGALSVVIIGLMIFAGCDLGMNPSILDGTTTGDFRLNLDSSLPLSFAGSKTVSLKAIRETAGNSVDSLRFYNLTIRIDSTTGTPDGTTLSGSVGINSQTVASFTNVPVPAFSTERSIFDTTGTGLHYNSAGVAYLISELRSTDETATLTVSGSSNSNTLHFTMHVKIYGQLFTRP